MPTEPEREIEKLLCDYAKRRRDAAGEPPGLSSGTRQVLLAEARRSGGPRLPGPRNWRNWLWGSIPRMASSSAVFAGLVALVVIGSRSWLAQKTAQSKGGVYAAKSSPEPAAVRAPAAVTPGTANRAVAPPMVATTPPATTPSTQSGSSTVAVDRVRSQSTPAALDSGAAISLFLTRDFVRVSRAAGGRAGAMGGRAGSGGGGGAATNFGAGGAGGVLSSFRVERRNDQLRVIDGDGSVYTGTVSASPPQTIAGSNTTSAPRRAGQAAPWYFLVSGTNLTTGGQVSFQGALIDGTAPALAAAVADAGLSGGLGGGRVEKATAVPVTNDRSTATFLPSSTATNMTSVQSAEMRIEGVATVGTNRIAVSAWSAPR